MADTTGLDPQFASAISAMIAASNGRLFIASGYRDEKTQAGLYANAVKKYGQAGASKWVAPPGHSNHNKGLAVDLGGDIDLAHKLAPQFGLVFPMQWEPWHIEPAHARDKASPEAYTEGPDGSTNPTKDTTLSSTLPFLAANLSSALNAKGPLESVAQGQFIGGGPSTTQQAGQPAQGSTGGGGGGGKASTNARELYGQLKGAGFTPAQAAAFVAIAGRESGYNAGAVHNDPHGSGDINSTGLFQINRGAGWDAFLHSHGMDPNTLNTVGGSVQAAKLIYDNSGFQPWGGYKGVSWSQGTNLAAAVDASGGEVSLADLQGLR